ncbi:MAG: NADPH-dependent F420 reductase [Burkholderiaceae bacterium]|nr:NADPH-dependent F420 reductase [Burkholderiaceae bacterium]
MTRIAIIGGTGALGLGLALRWAHAGLDIIIGSRRLESAMEARETVVRRIREHTGQQPRVDAAVNPDAAAQAGVVVLAVPFAQQQAVLSTVREHVLGKLVVDTTVPLVPPKVGTVQLPECGSAAVAAQLALGDATQVISAFHNVAADSLQSLGSLDCDVLVFGNEKQARERGLRLVEAAGMRAFEGGPLANSIAAEAMTSVLITINRQHKCHAGIRITGTEC